ncbi:MAG: type II toxin-antitoxin system HicB family antitoxin [Methylomonas sp.]
MSCFKYKTYTGSIEISLEDNCLHGKILNIADLITYEAEAHDELKAAFQAATDDYIAFCAEMGKDPNKPFKGSFNVRIGQELHAKAAKRAQQIGKSLNDYIKDVIKADTEIQI